MTDVQKICSIFSAAAPCTKFLHSPAVLYPTLLFGVVSIVLTRLHDTKGYFSMQLTHKAAYGLALLTGLGLAAIPAAHAQTVLSGSYNNQTRDGYDTTSGQSYIVTPTATFDSNGQDGLAVNDSSIGVTVNGGQFEGNSDYGLLVDRGTATFNGGTINDNLHNLSVQGNGTLNIYGGSITNAQHDGLIAEDGTINIYGGTISGSGAVDLLAEFANSTITLYGTFSQYGLVTGSSGTITGSLVDGGGPQTFTYSQTSDQGTGIFLVQATSPVPEASSVVSLGLLLLLGAGGVAVICRRRAKNTMG